MRTTKQTRKITTGKVWTPQHKKLIKALTKSNAPVKVTATRLQILLTGFRTRSKKLTKAANGRKRH